MVRFLHLADLHLGMRITRFEEAACKQVLEARFMALENARAKAKEHGVDFVLIAGDLFDDHTVSTTVAQRPFALFEGKSVDCPVYIIPGNHDPLTPGGVWDRDPWHREQPTRHLKLLRVPEPVKVPGLPVTIFPCPLRNRNSTDDPTAWIAAHPRESGDDTIRIGLAHGSLNMLPNLPLDDHLIRRDAADALGLDYLALGHWHKELRVRSRDGHERTAYSGTHEPLSFPDSKATASTGWAPCSGDRDVFEGEGRGKALLVEIEEAGAPPVIQALEVGSLTWCSEVCDVTLRPIGEITREYAGREKSKVTLLRLKLTGVLEPRHFARLREVVDLVEGRYHVGSRVHTDDVKIAPSAEDLDRLVGDGVLSRLLERLRDEAASSDESVRGVADHALKRLFEIVCSEGAP